MGKDAGVFEIMMKYTLLLSLLLTYFSVASANLSQPPATDALSNNKIGQTSLVIKIDSIISTASLDYIERAMQECESKNCASILMYINTPGGDLLSTRKIVSIILNSPIPFLCFLAPRGSHAGSAGAIIMQACHVSGAMPGTNIGAATPVDASGADVKDDLRKKLFNDTLSWLESITTERKRNLDFSKKIITEAKAVSSEEAVRLGAIDILAESELEFLKAAEGREVKVKDQMQRVYVQAQTIFETDARFKILELVSDPQHSYLLFMGSLALLYFEFTHPGLFVPGVVGGLGLVMSLVGFQKLEVSWGGVALMLLGLIFMIAEAFVPSFGALGVGGIIAFSLGGFLLFHNHAYYSIPHYMIFGVSAFLGAIMLALAIVVFRTKSVKSNLGDDNIIGAKAKVIYLDKSGRAGNIMLNSERWRFECEQDLELHDEVCVLSRAELLLKVEKVKEHRS